MYYFCTMPTTQDSIKTVIAYPKNKATTHDEIPLVTTERKAMQGTPLYKPSYDAVLLGAFVLSTVLLFVIYVQIKKQVKNNDFFSGYFALNKTENAYIYFKPLSVLQYILSLLTLSSLGYYFLNIHTDYSTQEKLLYVLTGIFLFLIIRTFLVFLTGYFISNIRLAISHLRIVYFFDKLTGIFLLPLVCIALFLPGKGYEIVLFATICIIIIKIIGLLIFVYKRLSAIKFSVFHSFLYLCTLEVLPILYIVIFVALLTNK